MRVAADIEAQGQMAAALPIYERRGEGSSDRRRFSPSCSWCAAASQDRTRAAGRGHHAIKRGDYEGVERPVEA